VINNAAIAQAQALGQTSREAFDYHLANNLSAPFALMAAASERMRDQVTKGRIPGSIINIGSAAGLYGRANYAAYSASKAGLIGITRSAALELSAVGINCNLIIPFAHTRVSQTVPKDLPGAAHYAAQLRRVPASSVANLVAWLASAQACRITGQVLGVRGREVHLFGQSQPIRTVYGASGVMDADGADALGAAIAQQFTSEFTLLQSDLQAFDSEVVI
jgi:NAD(P)-dependent dehydrogenase (short-subunit alcohol dehydrogenase family)